MTKTNPITTILVILLLSICSACTQNNGDIGIFFGTWSVEEMTVNDVVPEDFTPGETMWSFQSSIIYVQRNLGNHDYYSSFGTWFDHQGTLTLNFTHSDNETSAGEGRYLAPTWLGFNKNDITELKYVTSESRCMVLTWTNPEGDVYKYTLKKTY
jgi:hypothetical protein